MIDIPISRPRVILYEGPRAEPLDRALRTRLLQILLERGYAVRRVGAAEISLLPLPSGGEGRGEGGEEQTELHEAADGSGPLLRNRAGVVKQRAASCRFASWTFGNKSADDVLAMVEALVSQTPTAANGKRWKPWFPVIDFDRCTNCMQCLSFCLFGVYGATPDGKSRFEHESNCKTDCPACSRVCPEVAIMFPKYKAGPINGDAISSEDVRREAMKIDISALLGGDIYSMLRDRSARAKSRFSKERDDERALEERQRCLEKLKTTMNDLDIPPEVLASLPSVDQIQARRPKPNAALEEALASAAEA